jgi:hypothetical protein
MQKKDLNLRKVLVFVALVFGIFSEIPLAESSVKKQNWFSRRLGQGKALRDEYPLRKLLSAFGYTSTLHRLRSEKMSHDEEGFWRHFLDLSFEQRASGSQRDQWLANNFFFQLDASQKKIEALEYSFQGLRRPPLEHSQQWPSNETVTSNFTAQRLFPQHKYELEVDITRKDRDGEELKFKKGPLTYKPHPGYKVLFLSLLVDVPKKRNSLWKNRLRVLEKSPDGDLIVREIPIDGAFESLNILAANYQHVSSLHSFADLFYVEF